MLTNLRYFATLEQLIKKYLNGKQVKKIREAYLFAYDAHDGQFRASGEPYIIHPVAVASILAEMKLDYEAIIAALLHDTIEDTSVTYQNIVDKFGVHVASLVEGVSKLDKLKFRNRQEAQAENFRKMVLAMVEDVRVILIKLADRTHNMRTLDSLRPDKRRRIAKETLEIYAPLAHRLGIHHMKTELEILGFTAMHPTRANVIEKVVASARRTRKELIQQILREISKRLKRAKIKATVEGIERNIYAIYQKMQQREQRFQSIMDIYMFRIIVKNVDSCYRALGIIHNLYKPRHNRFKDYIAIPKVNGYQSLHSSLIGPYGTPVEVQIRTADMDQIAEMGVVAHWAYNTKAELKNTTAQIKAKKWLQTLLELQQNVGNSFEFIENVKSDLFPKEIYVFTPKGRIVELPDGATPVDLAYAVHTDIGYHCVGAMVDRKAYPLSQPLSNGQTVEIVTLPSSRPNAGWLNFVVSSKARFRIKQALKNIKREEAIILGKKLLNYSLAEQGGIDNVPAQLIEQLIKSAKVSSFEDLLAEIGLGNIMSQSIVSSIEKNKKSTQSNLSKTIAITGTEGLLVTFAKCCHPIPNDPIIGQINSDKGITIHHESCHNIIDDLNHADKYTTLTWDPAPDQLFVAEIRIEIIHNAATALEFIISTINIESANVQWLNIEERDTRIYTVILHIGVRNSAHLNEIIHKIYTHHDIVRVTRNIN